SRKLFIEKQEAIRQLPSVSLWNKAETAKYARFHSPRPCDGGGQFIDHLISAGEQLVPDGEAEHELTIAPSTPPKSGHSCPEWVISGQNDTQGLCPLYPQSGQTGEGSTCPLCAISVLTRCSKKPRYSVIWSARASSVGGTSRGIRGTGVTEYSARIA